MTAYFSGWGGFERAFVESVTFRQVWESDTSLMQKNVRFDLSAAVQKNRVSDSFFEINSGRTENRSQTLLFA